MSDSIFKTTGSDAMLNSRLNRVEGAIPYLRRANQVYSISGVKVPSAASVNRISSSALSSGTINPNTGIQAVGNAFPFVIRGSFNFTATPTSITLYWDGTNGSTSIVVKRVDGTSFTVPLGSMTIGGLQPSTTYGFLPYNKLTSSNNLSFSLGDIGTPQFAFSPSASVELIAVANQNQKMASNEAVTSGFIYYTTPASGTNAGNGNPGVLSPYSGVRFPPGTVY